MKALSLWQPWASLVALGVKTVETRSWSTKYRGPLAIHAGLYRPPLMQLPPLWAPAKTRDEQRTKNSESWLCIDTITDPAHMRPHRKGERVPKRSTAPTLFFPGAGPHARRWDETTGTSATEQGSAIVLPLGAIVATCQLVDVLPMVDACPPAQQAPPLNGVHRVLVGEKEIWRTNPSPIGGPPINITEQMPFGDFRPGRFAWILEDIKPTTSRCPACMDAMPTAAPGICVDIDGQWWHTPGSCRYCAGACPVCVGGTRRVEPVPAKGHQGLWNWAA